ncbi:MAG: Fis family sigma-54 specific transcriptional regulator [bacterium P3]|nr:MAG: Fis family sigma-54 specific transcriptional regulator [bacterium P3]KWW38981.1 MAG: Fis family sigma-54 specific transcriptional regulator [bacterium F083]
MDLQTLKNRYDIIGNDGKLLIALNKAIQVAATDLSILITGESGVGKDVFSRIIHDNSLRKHAHQGKGLISVNCGAIPEGTIESELFGHVKGAFTGADKDRRGYFEEADGGTIFLDEIGELPLSMQVKLLRVLENGEIIPVGSSVSRKVNVRIVAATNVDILAAVRNGRFRDDLYYRLNQISIYIPPLRERRDDIPLLFRKFSSDVAEKYKMPPIFLTDDARSYLMGYPWYGNIRELKNLTEQIAVVETERTITRSILQNYLSYVPEEKMPAVVEGQSAFNPAAISDRELLLKALSMGQMINEMRSEINELRQALTQLAHGGSLIHGGEASRIDNPVSNLPVADPAAGHDAATVPVPAYNPVDGGSRSAEPDEEFQYSEVIEDEPLALDERERRAIMLALDRHKGNRRLAAQELRISERTLYRKIKEYNI